MSSTWRGAIHHLIAGVIWGLGVAGAQAAPVAPATEPSSAMAASGIEANAPAEITARADADEAFVQAVMRRAVDAGDLQRFDDALDRQSAAVRQLGELTSDSDLSLLPVRRLESLQRHWLL